MRACAENGLPPSSTGVGSPIRRLNSRAKRSGSVWLRRSAASPMSISPSDRSSTTDGISSDRVPSVATSARPLRMTAAAV